MRDAASYRGNRRNFFRDAMGSIRHWKRIPLQAIKMHRMAKRTTAVHPTYSQTR